MVAVQNNSEQSSEVAEFELAQQGKGKRRRGTGRHRAVVALVQLVVLLVILGTWQLISGHGLPTYSVSKPTSVGHALYSFLTSSAGWHDIKVSMTELAIGYVIGVAAGAGVGILLAVWRWGAEVLEPFISVVNGIPKIALAPVFLIMLGLGIWSKVAIAAMTVFFVLFYNTYYGTRSIPSGLTDTVRILGANRVQLLRNVILPGILPTMIAGLRLGVPFAIIGVVVGEFIAASAGIGYYINNQTAAYNAAGAFAGIIILALIVLVLNFLVGLIEKYGLRWQR